MIVRNLYTQEADKAAELEIELRKVCSPEAENEKAVAFQAKQLEDLTKQGFIK